MYFSSIISCLHDSKLSSFENGADGYCSRAVYSCMLVREWVVDMASLYIAWCRSIVACKREKRDNGRALSLV